MIEPFKKGDLVVIHLPPERRSKKHVLHGMAGILRQIRISAAGNRVADIKLGEPENRVVHVLEKFIIKATPENNPEHYI